MTETEVRDTEGMALLLEQNQELQEVVQELESDIHDLRRRIRLTADKLEALRILAAGVHAVSGERILLILDDERYLT